MLAKTVPNCAFRFLGVELTDSACGDIVIGLLDHFPYFMEPVLPFLERIQRFPKDVLFRFKLTGLDLRFDSIFEIFHVHPIDNISIFGRNGA